MTPYASPSFVVGCLIAGGFGYVAGGLSTLELLGPPYVEIGGLLAATAMIGVWTLAVRQGIEDGNEAGLP